MHELVFRGLAVLVIALVPGVTTQILIGNVEPGCADVRAHGVALRDVAAATEGCRRLDVRLSP